mgnify:CR=1 FL=1
MRKKNEEKKKRGNQRKYDDETRKQSPNTQKGEIGEGQKKKGWKLNEYRAMQGV